METAVITGASGGLGQALTGAFLDRGWRVICHSRTLDSVTVEAERIVRVCGDLRQCKTLNRIISAAKQYDAGVLVNNAATYLNCPIDETTPADAFELIETNLVAPVMLTIGVWSLFKTRGGGVIVNINSLAGRNGGKGESLYCATKHGLAGFGKALQFDGTRDNVRVMEVYVGAMRTNMSATRVDHERFIDPIEVAGQVVQSCFESHTMRLTELTITRSMY